MAASLLILSLLQSLAYLSSSAPISGVRLYMTHIDSMANFTTTQLIHRSMERSKQRASVNNVRAAVHPGSGEFLVDLAIGTPPVPFSAILDTGSDLTWTQSEPCTQCFKQPSPIFNPSRSSSLSMLPCHGDQCKLLGLDGKDCRSSSSSCMYEYNYADGSSTEGFMANDTLTIGPAAFPNFAFGCTTKSIGYVNHGLIDLCTLSYQLELLTVLDREGFKQASGIFGVGRDGLSLVSQLDLPQFTYCLTSFPYLTKSTLILGLGLGFRADEVKVQSTRILRNSFEPSFYYVNLKGIQVGGTLINIPDSTFALKDDGTGGMMIDSGTAFTVLEAEGYKVMKKAFTSQMKLAVDKASKGHLCFKRASGSFPADVPKLVFFFEGAEMDLPVENYFKVDMDSDRMCLMMRSSHGISILGNYQQQNMRISFDLKREMLSFVPAKCEIV